MKKDDDNRAHNWPVDSPGTRVEPNQIVLVQADVNAVLPADYLLILIIYYIFFFYLLISSNKKI